MIQLGKSIYSNFNPFDLKVKRTKVKAMIMGQCGNGKTTLMNNLCSSQFETGICDVSLTRMIKYADVKDFAQGQFRFYDTPGTDSLQDTLNHANILRYTLKSVPLNLVLIQARFDTRPGNHTFSEFHQHKKMVKGYQQNIVFMTSHIDLLDNMKQQQKQKILKSFQNVLEKNKFKGKVILYSNKNSDFQVLSRVLFHIGSSIQQKYIDISDQMFYKYFRVSFKDKGIFNQLAEQYIEEVKDVADAYIEFVRNNIKPYQDENDDLISDMKMSMNYQLKQLQHKQYEKIWQQMEESESQQLYLRISSIVISKLEQFDNVSDVKLNKRYYYEGDSKNYDIRDMIKKCPSCGQIWMRSQGCDGSTNCGNKPRWYDFFRNKKVFRYIFKRDGKKITVFKNTERKKTEQQIKQAENLRIQQEKKKKQQEQKREEQQKVQQKQESSKKSQVVNRGCGRTLIWRQLPRLPNIEEILSSFYGVSNFEEIKVVLKLIEQSSSQFKENNEKKICQTLNECQKSLL